MGERRSLIHLLGDYAEISSLLIGGGFTTTLLQSTGKVDFQRISDYDVNQLVQIGGMCGLAVLGAYIFLKAASLVREPVLKNFFKLIYYTFYTKSRFLGLERDNNSEGLIKLIEENRPFWRHESGLDLEIAKIKLKKEKIDDSIEYFRRFFRDPIRTFSGPEILERIVYSSLRKKAIDKIRKDPRNVKSYFDLIDTYLTRGEIKEGVEVWDALCTLSLDGKVEFNVLLALFLEAIEKNMEKLKEKRFSLPKFTSEEQWKRTIEIIINRNLEFCEIGVESRNKVLEIGPSEFLKNTFVFKRGENKGELRRGFGVNSGLYRLGEKILGKDELQLVRSLYFADDIAGLAYDVSQRKPLRNLDDAFDKIDSDLGKARLLVKALKNERKIHEISREALRDGCFEVDDIKIELKPYDYTETINRRLLGRFGSSQKGTDLTEIVVDEISPYSERFECILNGDLAISNLLEDGSVIDYEKACIGNPVIDAVTTLEDPKNGRTGKNWLFKHYYLDQVDGREREFLEESYKPHAVFISMCQTGSKFEQAQRKRDQAGKAKNEFDKAKSLEKAEKDIERSRGFARQVIEKASPKTKDRFVNYLRSSEKATEIICAL